MQLHNLKKNTANKKAKQVGRGGVHGKTSGRGTKGQNARSGRKKRPEMRDVIKRLPKLRGRGVNSLKSRKEKPLVVNFSEVKKHFKTKEEITAKLLLEKGIIKTKNGRVPKIKVLNG
jgi:large subunit ribosomal protein L15